MKNCPICKNPHVILEQSSENPDFYSIACPVCGLSLDRDYEKDEVIEIWDFGQRKTEDDSDPMGLLYHSVCFVVDQQNAADADDYVRFNPESIDHPWDLAVSISLIPEDKQEEFVDKVYDLTHQYRISSEEGSILRQPTQKMLGMEVKVAMLQAGSFESFEAMHDYLAYSVYLTAKGLASRAGNQRAINFLRALLYSYEKQQDQTGTDVCSCCESGSLDQDAPVDPQNLKPVDLGK